MTRSPSMDVSAPAVDPLVRDAPSGDLSDAHLYSRFVQRLQRRYGDILPMLAPGLPTRESLTATFSGLLSTGLDTSAALRVLRQITLERLAQIDCQRQACLDSVTRSMTRLAEVTLDIAWRQVMADLDVLHGQAGRPRVERVQRH